MRDKYIKRQRIREGEKKEAVHKTETDISPIDKNRSVLDVLMNCPFSILSIANDHIKS